MASGAGALQLRLGGGAFYHGHWRVRPELGEGTEPQATDIARALRLVQRALLIWVGVAALAALLDWRLGAAG